MNNRPPILAPITMVLLAVSIVGCLAAFFATGGNEHPYDSTDNPPARSGASILVDELTGCHYLRTPAGGLAPRLGADGKPLCGAEVPHEPRRHFSGRMGCVLGGHVRVHRWQAARLV